MFRHTIRFKFNDLKALRFKDCKIVLRKLLNDKMTKRKNKGKFNECGLTPGLKKFLPKKNIPKLSDLEGGKK